MDITFKSKSDEKLFNDYNLLKRTYGQSQADRICLRLDHLRSAANLKDAYLLPGNVHPLKGDKRETFSIDIIGQQRLLFIPVDINRLNDGGLNTVKIKCIQILGVDDTHDGKNKK